MHRRVSILFQSGFSGAKAVIAASMLLGCASDVQPPAASAGASSGAAATTGAGGGTGGAAVSSSSTDATTSSTGGEAGQTTSASTTGSGGDGGTGGGGTGGAGGVVDGPGDVLDPTEVYLLGTLQEGACYRDVLARWSAPQGATAGFDCYFDNSRAMIRPTDGRLIYTNVFEDLVREFHCDACTYTGVYPNDFLANDTILPSLPCMSGGLYPLQFEVAPDGAVLHTCTSNPLVWYDSNGVIAYNNAGDHLLHLGFGGHALTMTRVVDLATMASVNIAGLPYAPILTTRAVPPDGFWVVSDATGPGQEGAQELWQIDALGAAVLVGAYPALPAGYHVRAESSRLDSSGKLFQLGGWPDWSNDVIFRRTVGGTTEVVYDEVTKPLVKLHISALLTGP